MNIWFLFFVFQIKMASTQLPTTYITALLLIGLHVTKSIPAKNNARPVIEIVNEQSRIDDAMKPPGILPYGNPLAGKSKQNARLHAQNQQAMFNAERVRQHRAQLQRWTKAPQQEDSYMKAYHESQENHQLALEQQHYKDNKRVLIAKAPLRPRVIHNSRQRGLKTDDDNLRHDKRGIKDDVKQEKSIISELDLVKITKEDAVLKENNRNHRSYGSVEYKPRLQSKKFQTVISLAPGPTYDQGVTIKPNGNNGLTTLSESTPSPDDLKLYTAAIPSETHYIYPKQYGQMQSYQSAHEIETLNSLLNKPAPEQLTAFNALINSEKYSLGGPTKSSLTTPIDLYFYLKDSSTIPKYYDQSTYSQIPPTYASTYTSPIKDHTPITEEIDDIEDPQKNNRLKHYGVKPVSATQVDKSMETTTTKSNNYYKVEVASQTISAPYKANAIHYYSKEEDKPMYEALQYAKPTFYGQETDSSERYLHHNAQHVGIQHLNEDGIGVSAYADGNVSISDRKNRIKIHNNTRKARSTEKLDSNPFIVPSTIKPLTETPIVSSLNETSKAEPLLRVNYFNNDQDPRTFLTTPNFPRGVATEYDLNDYVDTRFRPNNFNNNDKYSMYEDDEEYDEDSDEYDSDYEEHSRHPFQRNRLQNYAPSASYYQNDLQGSFSKKFRNFQRPSIGNENFQNYGSYSPQNSYGVPAPEYGPPQGSYGIPLKYGNPISSPDFIEPVYMLTQSQLKNLIGDSNLNIQHYDIHQSPRSKSPRRPKRARRPRKSRNRYSRKHVRKNLSKLGKLRYL